MIILYAFYQLVLLKTIYKDLIPHETPSCCYILLFIPVYICSVLCISFSVVYPRIFLESHAVQGFHRTWMGYTKQACTSWLILIAQTAYFAEIVLELTIISGVLSSYFNTHFARVYLSFAIINAIVRVFVFGIRFLELLYAYLKDDFFGTCLRPAHYTYVWEQNQCTFEIPT